MRHSLAELGVASRCITSFLRAMRAVHDLDVRSIEMIIGGAIFCF